MRNPFNTGSQMVRSELKALGPRGPYQLTIAHGQGTIVEYFTTSKAALLRQAELEKLLQLATGPAVNNITEKEPV